MPTDLPTRDFGRTGLKITPVGFGAWAIGGNMWGPQDDGESVAAIRHAVEAGVNWIDTAAVYGNGHSEEVVAKALDGMADADRPYVFTKGGIVRDAEGKNPRRVSADLAQQCEDSLRRLKVDVIDLYQVHWPADDIPLEEYWATALRLKEQGKVAHVGLSNHDAAQLETAEAMGHVETLQPPFSMIRRETAESILPWCAAHDTGVICYSPMQSGLLSGRFSRARAEGLDANDWRRANPEFSGDKLEANLALADALRPVAERHGVTPGAVAIAWTLDWPGLTAAIVGARSPSQVDGWMPAATLQLTDEDRDTLSRAIQSTGAGSGPVRA
ncbi:aldo/keto reductase [Wenxinia marina]|uniref:Putative oxidoreductase n=1 Tax=Wenxinia marina DSM 24838 TaxID=1123501 RepID=A0A0D0NQ37_9RHOB|nr:aldo/keto reductase [Wenxinia marina]KIQ70395.1 putative oxidoreductase [Wenxinia marina DSM 24838]GGL53521.1 aldo/keto reductase [Wenxinia marina]